MSLFSVHRFFNDGIKIAAAIALGSVKTAENLFEMPSRIAFTSGMKTLFFRSTVLVAFLVFLSAFQGKAQEIQTTCSCRLEGHIVPGPVVS